MPPFPPPPGMVPPGISPVPPGISPPPGMPIPPFGPPGAPIPPPGMPGAPPVPPGGLMRFAAPPAFVPAGQPPAGQNGTPAPGPPPPQGQQPAPNAPAQIPKPEVLIPQTNPDVKGDLKFKDANISAVRGLFACLYRPLIRLLRPNTGRTIRNTTSTRRPQERMRRGVRSVHGRRTSCDQAVSTDSWWLRSLVFISRTGDRASQFVPPCHAFSFLTRAALNAL